VKYFGRRLLVTFKGVYDIWPQLKGNNDTIGLCYRMADWNGCSTILYKSDRV